MSGYTTVSARMSTDLKCEAERVLNAIGLTHSSAITALYSQIVMQGGIPFELKMSRPENLERGITATMQNAIGELADRYGISRVWLFGSRARNEAHEGSDIDLLIEKGDIRGLELGGFVYDLEQKLGIPVDVSTTSSLSEEFRLAIEKDKVLLYER